ncbi:MAG: VOC family protein [Candidatus Hodarchaeales archaeon]|jgi:PhnB protein
MVNSIPYLMVKNGKEAINVYERMFSAKLIEHQPFTEEIGKQFGFSDNFDYTNSTMHAEIDIGGARLYLSDKTNQVTKYENNVEVVLDLDTKDQIDTFYQNAIGMECKIKMKLEKTFWGAFYARIEDPFGIGWQLNFSDNS